MRIQRLITKIARITMSGTKYARFVGVKMGKNCSIATKNFSSEPYLIEMGDLVRVANDVKFFTHGGVYSQHRKYNKSMEHFGKIKIGNYTYIGDSCLVMGGVTIGNDVIVAAGTVVTKSIPDGVMVAGNPMRIIGNTEDFVKRMIENDVMGGNTNLVGKARRQYIESLPEERFDHKGFIK
ncbi:MAG: acyltransferase [Bacteroidales bacterium]|nr:acyltransferase [Bacteroidales bacterium]